MRNLYLGKVILQWLQMNFCINHYLNNNIPLVYEEDLLLRTLVLCSVFDLLPSFISVASAIHIAHLNAEVNMLWLLSFMILLCCIVKETHY